MQHENRSSLAVEPPLGVARGARLSPRLVSGLLWGLAVVMMLATMVYQRLTGPTHPLRGVAVIQEQTIKYRLIRSENTTKDAAVEIPAASDNWKGTLYFKRYKTSEQFIAVPMSFGDHRLVGSLPRQPAAGKLEYYVELEANGQVVRLPEADRGNVVIRYKDPVPGGVLIPHILFMFLAVLIGIRAGLSAAVGLPDMRRLVNISLGCVTVGGLVLGPMVQKYAFGAYWTGFPFGKDLTDNKVLVMWLCLAGVAGILAFGKRLNEKICRVAVGLGVAVMLTVYLIPHSMRGSELDYQKVDRGVDPKQAIETGR